MQTELKKPDKTADFDLVKELIKQRSKNALEKLYEEHFDFVYRFVYSRTGNKEITEDIVSDTWTLVIENVKKFNFHSSFRTFLIGFSVNLIRRHHGRKKDQAFDEEIFSEDVEESETAMPKEPLINKIQLSLPKLSDKYRKIIEIRFVEGKSLKETAELMKISVGNVKVTQNRAISKLKELLLPQ